MIRYHLRLFFFIILLVGGFGRESTAQNEQVPIGFWRDHFPYDRLVGVAEGEGTIYGATELGIIAYRLSDNSIERINKVHGLSDIGINSIRFHDETSSLLVGYDNGIVDLVSNEAIHNITDIENSSILASKTINDFLFKGDSAYLSCGFGIVLMDVPEREVRESYMIGNNSTAVNVKQSALYKDSLFGATAEGIFKAALDAPNLSDFQHWEKVEPLGGGEAFHDIVNFNGTLYAFSQRNGANDTLLKYHQGNWEGTDIEPLEGNIMDLEVSSDGLIISQWGFSILVDENEELVINLHGQPWEGNPVPVQTIRHDGEFFWADRNRGLGRAKDPWNGERIQPNGPKTTNSFDMTARGDELWVATGQVDQGWNPEFINDGVLRFHEDDWETYTSEEIPALDSLFDPVSVAIDPEDQGHVFIGSWGSGLWEFKEDELVQLHHEGNSTLSTHPTQNSILSTWGLDFDEDGNLWVTNSYSNEPVSVLTQSGEWHSLHFNGHFDADDLLGPIRCSSIGLKWVVLPRRGLFVFDDKGTPGDPSDDEFRELNTNPGNGGLPSDNVYTVVEDKDNEIWVGTEDGIGVFYTPDDILSNDPSDADEILVDHGGFLEPLLDNEEVSSIAVDGADNKWLGTNSSGVFQVSPDGKTELQRFSVEESPLISNSIQDIAVHEESGEVFFGTDKGIVAYRAQATEGKETLEELEIYPNPVGREHNGPVAIRGLPSNSSVKITDVSGSMVFQSRSEGGQVVWDGTDRDGMRVRTGVYLVFVASPGGEQSMAGKIMFFH